jgi:Mn2+/Fe2+ NRAMP family transporter
VLKTLLGITLGLVTSVGGFLEVGSIATAAQAGAEFGYRLIWAIVLGTVCLIFLLEMSGRLAVVSKHTIADAIRDRFGYPFYVVLLAAMVPITLLTLASEVGGVSLALQLATGVRFPWWVPLAGLGVWLLLWKGTFGVIEKGASTLGLVTVAFVVGALELHPAWPHVAAGALPSLPTHDAARYWFLAVSILGASISPYLLFFYSSGAIEDRWSEGELAGNRVTAGLGTSVGGLLSVAVLIVAALVFLPRGIRVERYEQLASMLTPAVGRWGLVLFAASLGVTCTGAALEVALSIAYMAAQGFGWAWSASARPRDAARFSLAYTVAVLLGAGVVLIGVDPLQLTLFTMALTAVVLPFAIGPFLVLMNDPNYVRTHRNGWVGNLVVGVIVTIAFVLAVVSIPLEILGG